MADLDFKSFPTTRYQGSKRKLLPWLYEHIAPLKFESVLDIFGGTGSVSYLFKKMGKKVTFNDYLKSNYFTGKALIENNHITLDEKDIEFLLTRHKTIRYRTFVQDTFSGIYYKDKENAWIDVFLTNWNNLSNNYPVNIAEYKKAIAFHCFAQSALRKRPFNLFHRANLNLRTKRVKRTFGNKITWEGSFEKYFKEFVAEVNNTVFSNGNNNKALNYRHSDFKPTKHYDLIYVDPPYVKDNSNESNTSYLNFYHFLEGAADIPSWKNRIDFSTKNLRIKDKTPNNWISPRDNTKEFENLINAFRESIIVISYKHPGIPSRRKLLNLLNYYKKRVISIPGLKYDYALNKNNGFHREYLLIGM